MSFHQPSSVSASSDRGAKFSTRITAKTAERYWQIFWVQLGLTIAAYVCIQNNSINIIFRVICGLWIQVVATELTIVPLIVMHEAGHASVAALLGVKVSKIVIGVGKTIRKFKIFDTPYIIAQFPIGGMVQIYLKSFEWYRLKHFAICFAGPLTHMLLGLFLWLVPLSLRVYITKDASIDLIWCLKTANTSLLFSNLWPYSQREIDDRGIERALQSDGLQMLKAPFMSDREIARSIADTHLIEGWEYLDKQEYLQAIESFYTALTINTDLVSAYQGTALIYQHLLDYPSAIDNFSKVVEFDISNTLAYLYRGRCYFDWGKDTDSEDEAYLTYYEKALDDFNTAITIDRTFVSAYYPRAAINYYLENLDLSLASYSKIIELSSSAVAYYHRAIIWWETGEDRLALADLDRAIELAPNFGAAYYWRGNIYDLLGDETRGGDDYELAQSIEIETALAPEDEHGFYARGIARARLGDRVGAMVDFHTATDLCTRYKNHITTRRIRAAIDRWNLV
jgi:Tfp pilus assembly protein PilF